MQESIPPSREGGWEDYITTAFNLLNDACLTEEMFPVQLS